MCVQHLCGHSNSSTIFQDGSAHSSWANLRAITWVQVTWVYSAVITSPSIYLPSSSLNCIPHACSECTLGIFSCGSPAPVLMDPLHLALLKRPFLPLFASDAAAFQSSPNLAWPGSNPDRCWVPSALSHSLQQLSANKLLLILSWASPSSSCYGICTLLSARLFFCCKHPT